MEPGSTLTVYTKKVCTVQDHAVVNDDTTRPDDVKFCHLAPTDNLILQNQSSMAAKVIVPNAQLQIQDGSDYYGPFYGYSVYLKNNGSGHFTNPRSTEDATYD